MKYNEIKKLLNEEMDDIFKILYEEGYVLDDEECHDEYFYFLRGRWHECASLLKLLEKRYSKRK